MTGLQQTTPAKLEEIGALVLRERRIALSEREWKHRLAGHGYGIAETAFGRMVTSLRGGRMLCRVPEESLRNAQ